MSRAMQKWVEDDKTAPEWIALGRTVTLPKSTNLSSEKDYRPLRCLNTSFKMFTGLLANFMKHHTDKNEMWDKSQMGTRKDVLGTVNQLLIDNCMMDEVKTHKRNLAVAFYDYKKAYDIVNHDWILRVCGWMGISMKVCRMIKI